MLFSCVPETGGCEWPNLQGFVAQLNSELDTKYQRVSCLDVEERNEKRPEILLKALGLPYMVIESKVVAWPEDYCRKHSNYHNFTNRLTKSLRSKGTDFDGSPYRLRIHENTFDEMGLRQVRNLADDLASQIYARKDEAKGKRGVRGNQPVTWHFGPGQPEEWGEPASNCAIMVQTEGSWNPNWKHEDRKIDDLESLWKLIEERNKADRERKLTAVNGFSAKLDEAIENTRQKFEQFDRHKRLLLVYFVGDSSNMVFDEDLCRLVSVAQLPTEIDEVWVAFPAWVNDWDYEIGWKRLR